MVNQTTLDWANIIIWKLLYLTLMFFSRLRTKLIELEGFVSSLVLISYHWALRSNKQLLARVLNQKNKSLANAVTALIWLQSSSLQGLVSFFLKLHEQYYGATTSARTPPTSRRTHYLGKVRTFFIGKGICWFCLCFQHTLLISNESINRLTNEINYNEMKLVLLTNPIEIK